MKVKTLILLGLSVLTFSACGSQLVVPEPQTSISEIETNLDFDYPEESETTEQQSSEAKVNKKPKKTLADIHINNSSGYSAYLVQRDESSVEDSTVSESFDFIQEEESSQAEQSSASRNHSDEKETITDIPSSYEWDSEVYKNLGVHAPTLDDWYKYIHSAIMLNGKVYEYTETSTEDPTKIVSIEMCDKPLYISSYFKEWQHDTEVNGKQCEESYNAATKEGEFLFSKDEIYYKLIFTNTEREEFDEIVNHIVSYV